MENRLLEQHLSVPDFAKAKKVSTAAVYKAIDANRLNVTYVGTRETAFIHPDGLNVEFRKKTQEINN